MTTNRHARSRSPLLHTMVYIALAIALLAAPVHAGGDARETSAPTDDAAAQRSAPPDAAPSEPATNTDSSPPTSGSATPQAPAPDERSGTERLEVARFSRSDGQFPPSWQPLEFPKIPEHTRYRLEREGPDWIVHATARASASGMIRKLEVDLERFPILRWRWKVAGVIQNSDVTQKSGDDYAARIYVAFKYEPERVGFLRKAQYRAGRALFGDIPIGALNYIWATRENPGQIYDNPFAGSFVKMIPVESGTTRAGEWIVEQRNVYEDYVRAFDEEPPLVEGVAIMTDTDNTGESIEAWYGDIEFLADDSAPSAP